MATQQVKASSLEVGDTVVSGVDSKTQKSKYAKVSEIEVSRTGLNRVVRLENGTRYSCDQLSTFERKLELA